MKISDKDLLDAIFNGDSIRKIAKDFEMSPTGVFNRLKSKKLQEAYMDIKNAEYENLKNRILFNSENAFDLLLRVMDDETQSTASRIKAAKEIINFATIKR